MKTVILSIVLVLVSALVLIGQNTGGGGGSIPNPLPVTGTVTTTPSGTQDVAGTVPNNTAVTNFLPVAFSDQQNNLRAGIVNSSGGLVIGQTRMALTDAQANNVVVVPSTTTGNGYPLAVVPLNFNGATWDKQYVCPTSIPINITSATTTQIVALSSSTVIRICSLGLTGVGTGVTAQLVYGTGTNCGTGAANISGPISLAAPFTIHLGSDGALRSASGNAVCITTAGTVTSVTGFATIAQF